MKSPAKPSRSFLGLRKLPARYAGIVLPLMLSILMTFIVSLISTLRSIGLAANLIHVWMGAWGHVVIRWIFRFEWLDGSVTRMEELAWQRWEGERIAEEQFFYDPAQRVPVRPA